MRAFLWLLTAAMGILCFSLWGIAQWAMRPFIEDASALPRFTEFFLRSHNWLLLAPVPWVIYSVILSVKSQVSPRVAFIFAGTISLAMTSVACVVLVGALMPYVPFKIH
jgi:hypothetical protein